MLALRFDLLPAAYCDELFKLLNQVAPFPYDDVREIVRQELGDDPEVVFGSFDPESFAAASIGQVHRAVLHSGERSRSRSSGLGSARPSQADIDLMYAMTLAARLDPPLRCDAEPRGHRRVRALDRRRARLPGRGAPGGPALYEHARGRPTRADRARLPRLHDVARADDRADRGHPAHRDHDRQARRATQAYLDALAARGHDLDRIVRHLDWNMLNQVYVFGYFHADLHPANLFVLPGDAIGYVDFGIVGQLPDRVRDSLTRYSWLLFRGEVEARGPRADALARPGTATDAGRRPLAAHPRPPGVPVRHGRGPVEGHGRVAPGRPGNAEPTTRIRSWPSTSSTRSASSELTMSAEHRRLPQDARHPGHAPPPARGRLRPARERPPLRPPPGPPAGPGLARPAPDGRPALRRDRSGPARPRVPRVRRSAGAGHHRGAPNCCSATDRGSVGQAAPDRASGSRSWSVGAVLYLVLVFPRRHARRSCPRDGLHAGSSSACWRCCSS